MERWRSNFGQRTKFKFLMVREVPTNKISLAQNSGYALFVLLNVFYKVLVFVYQLFKLKYRKFLVNEKKILLYLTSKYTELNVP